MNMDEFYRVENDIQRIKLSGGTAELSIAQITYLIINLQDAQHNLSGEQFAEVFSIFQEMQRYTTKMKMDFNGYLDTAVKIIRRFDEVAPYEKYSGNDEEECALMMEDIRTNKVDEVLDHLKSVDKSVSTREIMIKRIIAVCKKYKEFYRNLIIENKSKLFIFFAENNEYNKDKVVDVYAGIRNQYYDKVVDEFLDDLQKEADAGIVVNDIYNRLMHAINKSSVCGLDRKWDDTITVGELYAMYYWAVTNKSCSEVDYKQISEIQEGILEEAMQEAIHILSEND